MFMGAEKSLALTDDEKKERAAIFAASIKQTFVENNISLPDNFNTTLDDVLAKKVVAYSALP